MFSLFTPTSSAMIAWGVWVIPMPAPRTWTDWRLRARSSRATSAAILYPHHPFTPSYDVWQIFEDAEVHEPFDPSGEGVRGTPVAQPGTDLAELTVEERRMIIRATYAMVYQIDQAVGRMIEGLRRTGLWEHTVVVFTSDHGDFMGDHGRLRKGYTPSDALLHLPFILRAPGDRLPDQVATSMSNVDVMPTLASLAGVSAPDSMPGDIHGRDMVEVVRAGDDHVALAYCSNGDPAVTNYTLYDDAYRFTLYPRTGHVELYDHRSDLGEVHNLAASEPELVAAMRRRVEAQLLLHRNPTLARVSAW